jgi:hypothetical protein
MVKDETTLEDAIDALVDVMVVDHPELTTDPGAINAIASTVLRNSLLGNSKLARAYEADPETTLEGMILRFRQRAAGVDKDAFIENAIAQILVCFDELAESLAKFDKPALLDKLQELGKRYGGGGTN